MTDQFILETGFGQHPVLREDNDIIHCAAQSQTHFPELCDLFFKSHRAGRGDLPEESIPFVLHIHDLGPQQGVRIDGSESDAETGIGQHRNGPVAVVMGKDVVDVIIDPFPVLFLQAHLQDGVDESLGTAVPDGGFSTVHFDIAVVDLEDCQGGQHVFDRRHTGPVLCPSRSVRMKMIPVSAGAGFSVIRTSLPECRPTPSQETGP